MNQSEIFEFPSFNGEHPFIGILLIPWNYSPCIIVAASWCLTHSTNLTRQHLMNMSMQNPYKVIAGFTDTGLQEASKNQICLGVKAVFHPNPTIVFVLIKITPEFQRTLFVDYQQLKYNAMEPVNEECESIYWSLDKREDSKNHFFYNYRLMNQIPCPYKYCHYSNMEMCSIFQKPKKNCISATILCNNHLMSFVEFSHEDGQSVFYHKITDEVIMWIKNFG